MIIPINIHYRDVFCQVTIPHHTLDSYDLEGYYPARTVLGAG